MKAKVVAFDLDDTLYPQRAWLSGAFLRAAEYLHEVTGYDPVPAQQTLLGFVEENGSAQGRLFNRLLLALGLGDDPELVTGMVEVFFAHRPESLPPYPGTEGVLRRLKAKGLRLAVISNGRVAVQRQKLDALGIRRFFDLVLVSEAFEPGGKKPDTRMFEALIDELAVAGTDCLYVGDNPHIDFLPARSAGMTTIRVLTGEYRGDVPAPGYGADVTIPDLARLPALLD